jgi:hypothetical protein
MSMLDSHPDICLPPETQLVTRFLGEIPGKSGAELVSLLCNDEKFQRLGVGKDDLEKMLSQGEDCPPFQALYRGVLDFWGRRSGAAIIGDKAPKYIEVLPVLKSLFPEAVVVHVIRDPRDVYLSRKKAEWSAGRPEILQYLAYRAQFRLGLDFGPALFGDNYLEVQYEQLLQDPEAVLTQVCTRLGVGFDQSMLDFGKKAGDLVFPDEKSWKKELFGPLLQKNFQKWKQELSPGQIGRIEIACPQPFREERYTVSGKPRIHDRLVMPSALAILDIAYRSKVNAANRKILNSFQSQKASQ